MTQTTPNFNAVGAAYCRVCETISAYEARDLFVGEVFCPACTSRTSSYDRGSHVAVLANKFPHAAIYPA
jgi:uncharacterized Zn finger protein (UPF0148 family)